MVAYPAPMRMSFLPSTGQIMVVQTHVLAWAVYKATVDKSNWSHILYTGIVYLGWKREYTFNLNVQLLYNYLLHRTWSLVFVVDLHLLHRV
jgi:hypothetical protein